MIFLVIHMPKQPYNKMILRMSIRTKINSTAILIFNTHFCYCVPLKFIILTLKCSLSLAADLLSTTTFIIVFFIIPMIFVSTTLSMRILLWFFQWNKLLDFADLFHCCLCFCVFRLPWENICYFWYLIIVEFLWEFNLEIDEQVSKFIWRFMERHAEPLATHHLIWLDDFSFVILNSDLTSIEMCYYYVETSKSV